MNLDNSVRLLDQAVYGKSVMSKSPPYSRNRSMKPQDYSITLQQHEILGLQYNETFGESLNSTAFRSVMDETLLDDATLLERQDNRPNPVDTLYDLFFEIVQSHETDSTVFQMLSELIQVSSDTLDTLQSFDNKSENIIRDKHWLNRERNTWRLLYCLYNDRLLAKCEDMETNLDLAMSFSEKNIIQKLYTSCSLLRETQLVVDWLEQSAGEIPRAQNPLQYTDRTISCENTLHHLQSEGNTAFGTVRPLVKHLDPDAPVREKLSIHDLDAEDQLRLAKSVFLDVRSGQLEEAQKTCCHCGEYWRAALLEGWRLYHDPNYENSEARTGEIKKLPEGNPNRRLWKLCAWKMSENSRAFDIYTRATIGAFCGHLDSMLAACNDSWEDLLWAYLKVQIDIRVETEIKHNYISNTSYTMKDEYWKNKMSLEQIFAEIAASRNNKVSLDARTPDRLIQKYIIMDDIQNLWKGMDTWILSDENPSGHFIRFLAHLIIFFRKAGKNFDENISNKVLESYVSVLIKRGNPQLVAYYTAQLPKKRQIVLYSQFLEHIMNSSIRKQCLDAAENVGLQIDEITKYTVKSIRDRCSSDDTPLQGNISNLDALKILALDYLMYNPRQGSEALWQANFLVRSFLSQGNIEAARASFNKVTPEILGFLKGVDIMFDTTLPLKDQCSVREYFCLKAYLESQDVFNDWFQHFHHGKPHPPSPLQSEPTFTEKVAMDHKKKQYEAELDRWSIALQHQTECIKKMFYNVLDFPGNGWLVDPVDPPEYTDEEEEQEWTLRKQQMENLRKVCIPNIVLLLHTVMHNVGEYQECVMLANTIMSDKNKFHEIYSKHKLSELLTKIAESSLALLNQKKDAWGYPISV
ncbi:nuclear pore complex protein Nup107 [Ctenocephalides felis]|uniref:nuclear pore complex protein Nup107 n=1 Tax=Ctenocephalides felis TaxID=7515 RepID=UPI000E6E584A|nr:nuclear pore complex protein Nup107 [Ctenocephalides felis]